MILGLNAYHGNAAARLLGGCVINSLANGKVYASSLFRKLYMQSTAANSGEAVGAAIVDWQWLQGWARGSALGD